MPFTFSISMFWCCTIHLTYHLLYLIAINVTRNIHGCEKKLDLFKTVHFYTSVLSRGSQRPTSMVTFKNDVRLPSTLESAPKTKFQTFVQRWSRYVDNHRLQIFWVTLYTLVTIGIFVERAYCE